MRSASVTIIKHINLIKFPVYLVFFSRRDYKRWKCFARKKLLALNQCIELSSKSVKRHLLQIAFLSSVILMKMVNARSFATSIQFNSVCWHRDKCSSRSLASFSVEFWNKKWIFQKREQTIDIQELNWNSVKGIQIHRSCHYFWNTINVSKRGYKEHQTKRIKGLKNDTFKLCSEPFFSIRTFINNPRETEINVSLFIVFYILLYQRARVLKFDLTRNVTWFTGHPGRVVVAEQTVGQVVTGDECPSQLPGTVSEDA